MIDLPTGWRILCAAGFLLVFSLTAAAQNPKVLIKTDAGDITVEIFEKQVPVTAGNFLRYVDEKRYEPASFYRVLRPDNQPKDSLKISIVQGGLAPYLAKQLPAVGHETTQQTGIRHLDGTISLVRQAPGTARSEFFICVGDQPALDFGGNRNPDGKGFAAFGKVISGMEVVRKIHRLDTNGQLLTTPVQIESVSRLR